MKGFNELLDHLTLQLDKQSLTLALAAQQMACYIQGQIACSRVSIWLLDTDPSGPFMRRLAGFDGDTGESLSDMSMRCSAEFAANFDRLTENGVCICTDMLNDERMAALRDSPLVAHDIHAALYATIGANGNTAALLCCAQRDAPRSWKPQEVRALKVYADAISLRQARRRRRVGEGKSRSLMQRLLLAHGVATGPDSR